MTDTPETKPTSADSPAGAPIEPEPIDAEFEPADDRPEAQDEKPAKSGVGLGALITASAAAALAGGAIGVVGSGSSGVDTAKFAPAEVSQQIKVLEKVQEDLNQRIQKVWGTVSEVEARTLGGAERVDAALEARASGEQILRSELEGLNAQLNLLLGADGAGAEDATATPGDDAGDDAPEGGPAGSAVAAASSPLKRLVDRIAVLETRLAEDAEGPDTPKQLQRAVRDLNTRIEAAETADADLQRALQTRADALAALQSGLFNANQAIGELEDRIVSLSPAEGGETASDPALRSELDKLKAQIDSLATTAIAPTTNKSSPPSGSPASSSPASGLQTPDSGTPDTTSDTGVAGAEEASAGATDAGAPTKSAATTDAALAPKAAENATSPSSPSSGGDNTQSIAKAALALADLEATSRRGKPFAKAYDRLATAMPNNKDVAALKTVSRRGAPPLSELKSSFASMEKALIRKSAATDKGDGWDWARQAFGGVVDVRRTDAEGDDAPALISRASKALNDDDLGLAIANAEKLDGAAAQQISDWLRDARLRLELDTHVTAVRDTILAQSTPDANIAPNTDEG